MKFTSELVYLTEEEYEALCKYVIEEITRKTKKEKGKIPCNLFFALGKENIKTNKI